MVKYSLKYQQEKMVLILQLPLFPKKNYFELFNPQNYSHLCPEFGIFCHYLKFALESGPQDRYHWQEKLSKEV